MTQAPAKVVLSIEPMGNLQLHRLGARVSFRCVLCQRDRAHDRVATRNGDWAQPVCIACYAHAFRVKRDRTADEASSVAKESNRQHSVSGFNAMLEFLREGGIDAKAVRGGCLKINGHQTRSLAYLPAQETLEWQMTADELVLHHDRSKFIKSVEDYAQFGKGLRTVLLHHEQGIAVMRGEIRLATIYPTRAQVPHQEVIYANFLVRGPHWRQVADILHAVEPELAAEWRRAQDATQTARKAAAAAAQTPAGRRRRITIMHSDLSPRLIDACLDASRRIRLDRQVAYERPVILESDVGELTLLPITGPETRLLMPFRLRTGTTVLHGELILGNRDPLELLIGTEVSDKDASAAWACALLGFADATCVEFVPAELRAPRELAARKRRSASSSPTRPASQAAPRRQAWPKNLEPVGRWIRFSSSFVAGHRRRLNDGQEASNKARARARQVGITLHPHQTWVRPHTRGVPDNIEMRFRWQTSSELAGLRHRPEE